MEHFSSTSRYIVEAEVSKARNILVSRIKESEELPRDILKNDYVKSNWPLYFECGGKAKRLNTMLLRWLDKYQPTAILGLGLTMGAIGRGIARGQFHDLG